MRGRAHKKISRSLRRNQTDAEKKLWNHLRSGGFLGLKFRRQLPLGPYVVDFCCLEKKLIVELDGGQHLDGRRKDDERTGLLEREGFQVIRIWDHEVLSNIEGSLETIRKRIGK